MSERASAPAGAPESKESVVHGSAKGFAQEITAGRHRLLAGEPVAAGGTDTGPTPYDLLLAGLGACARLLDIANRCPVHRTLTSEIRTRLV